MRKILAAALVLLAATACGDDDAGPVNGDGTPKNLTWATVTTPDGRTCDLATWSEGSGHRGFGYMGMDCEDRPGSP